MNFTVLTQEIISFTVLVRLFLSVCFRGGREADLVALKDLKKCLEKDFISAVANESLQF